MPDYQVELVNAYGKRDLFQRFALDNFAAVHRLVREGRRVRPSIRRYHETLKAHLGTRVLDQRLSFLERARLKPAF
jgi:hypothetical protein